MGELAVASQPRMRARSNVSGKKIFEFPRTSWSKKFLAPVRKFETSKVQPSERDGESDFVLFVALAVQRQEAETFGCGAAPVPGLPR